jgi:HD-GYP domain-containing protein (c-di-GMP phosphodiesterase class II)
MDSNAPRGTDWGEIIEALHFLANTMTVRSHYPEGHPAIRRADDIAGGAFVKLLERLPEVVVALIDDELVICERPMPDLRDRLHVVVEGMTRHRVECLVFQRGMAAGETALLGRALASAVDPAAPNGVRDTAQAQLPHVLLRFVELRREGGGTAAGTSAFHFVPLVADTLRATSAALAEGKSIDVEGIRALAKEILATCSLRTFVLTHRAWTRSFSEMATHATNVAMMTGATALEARVPHSTCIELTAAALLHDIGQLLLPEEIAGLPEPLLDEKARLLFRNHTFAGASALLAAAAPPLWVAAALEHHRGVDGGGYPALETSAAPHELIRMIGLANFYDRKRTLLDQRIDAPEEVLRQAAALEDRYFGKPLVERFVRALGVYPPGTTVELSDREPALVLAANASDPWRPRVLLLRGKMDGRRIDLRELNGSMGQHRLSIVREIAPPLFLPSDIVAEEAPEELVAVAEAPAPPRKPRTDPRQEYDPDLILAAMPDLLDNLIVPKAPAGPMVTTPPAAPSARPAAPLSRPSGPPSVRIDGSYSSSRPPQSVRYNTRPVSIEELVKMAPRASAPPPSGRSMPPVTSPAIMPPAISEMSEEDLLARIGSLARVPTRTGMTPPGLDHRGGFILTFIDGMSSLEDIIDACGLPSGDVLRIVHDLMTSSTIVLR